MRRVFVPSLLIIAASASAQSVGARTSPQFVHYTLGAPSNNTISELAIPLFAVMPISPMLTLDIGTAFASAKLTNTTNGQATESTISGLTDTQLRATVNLATDMVVLTGGLNIPTGRSTVKPEEQAAAGLIGNDFLIFPISSMGSGFGGTGGIALARPMGDWNLGAGLSVRHSMPFDPYQDAAGAKLHYIPGNETRARVGLDHPYGTGRASVGVTYSKLSNDQIATSVYNTGDRLLTQGYITSAAGTGDYMISAWDLFRASGTQADGSATGRDNITDLSASYGMPVGAARLEPGIGFRTWMQQGSSLSLQTSLSLRYDYPMGSFTVSPSGTFTVGKLATGSTAATPGGVSTQSSASLSGFRAALTIRTH